MAKKYFLAANSTEGFVSYFSNSYDPLDGWQAYIIKGGPGTGKSSFMKKLSNRGEELGCEAELCPCSSDPDSLDAVIFPKLKKVIMDGTAPHIVDPIYPAAVDTILDFGQFWDTNAIKDKSKEIISITNKNKALHKTAAMYLSASGQMLKDNYNTVLAVTDSEKARRFAQRLCKRFFKKQGSNTKTEMRFLTGISPKGIISYPETIFEYCKEPVIIKDNHGAVCDIIMREIRNESLKNKYKIIIFKNPFLPDLIDHIAIPELSLAFVRESEYFTINSEIRRIHAERFIENDKLKIKRLKYNNKTAKILLNSAVDTLKQAKAVHDDLEKYYVDAMDFNALFDFFKEFSAEFFK